MPKQQKACKKGDSFRQQETEEADQTPGVINWIPHPIRDILGIIRETEYGLYVT